MKKEIIAIAAAAILLIGLIVAFGLKSGETNVKFEKVSEKVMPRELEADILPEYRDLERALACKVGGEIYIIVTRGEKATAGYEAEIDKLTLENKEDKSNLVVYATFADPAEPENMAQISCYPIAVVKTDLKGLPDTIELRAEYAK
ncbi:protease complex subunit PrcB family protein [Senimuribacter intestinalis]|uniref:protease complex subunit PrcB family protein n=1 Tax=Senimuribacter intestinalis TaxID=2941507 RepID=UPI002040AD57|nr:protease complex subunit PrcB family protein [Senimuribacter intestinalis]